MHYFAKGITVNGVAPALIQDTKMLPGANEEIAKSEFPVSPISNFLKPSKAAIQEEVN